MRGGAMRKGDGVLNGAALLIGLLRYANLAVALLMVAVLLGTFLFAGPLSAQLSAKYAGKVAIPQVIGLLRILPLAGLASAWQFHRLLQSLRAMVASVRAGDPFVAANAARLRIVGWSLLMLQIIDLFIGAMIWWARAHHIDVIDWQPSILGWLGVLIAFILARVFAVGTEMRTDLDGTI